MRKNRACPACRANNHDTDGDHLFLMKGGDMWACYKEDYHESGEPYFEAMSLETKEERDEEETIGSFSALQAAITGASKRPEEDGSTGVVPSVSTCSGDGSLTSSEYRGIPAGVYKKYGVRALYLGSTLMELEWDLYATDGSVCTQKVRKLPKDFFTRAKTKGVKLQLFGQHLFPSAKRLLITEGEQDALAAYHMLVKYKVAVVSLPTGSNTKAIVDNLEYLLKFTEGNRELYMSMDEDEPGRKVAKEIASLIPKIKDVRLPKGQDANQMLVDGKEEDFRSAFWGADRYKPDTIVRVEDILDKVLKTPTLGRPWPWPTLTDATYGRNDGEGIYVGAGVKIGKSEFINEVIAFDCQNGWPIGVLKYEENPAITVKRVAGKMDGIAYHRPGVVYNPAQLESTARKLHPMLFMYPAFGPASWKSTKEFILYAVGSGCKTIIVDPVTKLTNHLDPSQTETELRMLSDEIACMAQDLGFFYIFTCHLKSPTSGPPHERGGFVQSNQFRGSRAMMENTFYMLGIERNKDPLIPEKERNTSYFVLLEDRNFGNSVRFPVEFNPTTQEYREMPKVF